MQPGSGKFLVVILMIVAVIVAAVEVLSVGLREARLGILIPCTIAFVFGCLVLLSKPPKNY